MRVLIADDHNLLRDTLELWLSQNGMEISSASDLQSALSTIESSQKFDVILLDYSMPGMNGLDGLEQALAQSKGARVAIMSGIATRKTVESALEMGAAGFLPKSLPAKSLVNAVRFMAMGESFVPYDYMSSGIEEPPPGLLTDKITPREINVLQSLCEGKTNKEIARELGLQVATVKVHVAALCRKMGVQNRTKAAMIARDSGMC